MLEENLKVFEKGLPLSRETPFIIS